MNCTPEVFVYQNLVCTLVINSSLSTSISINVRLANKTIQELNDLVNGFMTFTQQIFTEGSFTIEFNIANTDIAVKKNIKGKK